MTWIPINTNIVAVTITDQPIEVTNDELTNKLNTILRQTEVNQNIIEELKIQTELLKELNT